LEREWALPRPVQANIISNKPSALSKEVIGDFVSLRLGTQ